MTPQAIFTSKVIFLLLVSCLLTAVCLRTPSTAQTPTEREIEDKIPKHVPLRVKIKPDKEKAVKDMKNEKWLSDFELEVTNTSDKPIYFLNLWIVLPEIISYENGYKVGFPLRYGRPDFIYLNTMARADDVPIRPGESYVFTIPEKYQKGWAWHKLTERRPNPKRIEITFTQLSFGDGSGFNGSDAKPYPYKNQESRAGPCIERGNPFEKKLAALGLSPHLSIFTKNSIPELQSLPYLSTKFPPLKIALNSVPSPQSSVCCPGTGCGHYKNSTYQCVCNSIAQTIEVAACSDPDGTCATVEYIDNWCDEYQVGCPESRIAACGAPTPTPSPTSSPSPTCDPNTKPMR